MGIVKAGLVIVGGLAIAAGGVVTKLGYDRLEEISNENDELSNKIDGLTTALERLETDDESAEPASSSEPSSEPESADTTEGDADPDVSDAARPRISLSELHRHDPRSSPALAPTEPAADPATPDPVEARFVEDLYTINGSVTASKYLSAIQNGRFGTPFGRLSVLLQCDTNGDREITQDELYEWLIDKNFEAEYSGSVTTPYIEIAPSEVEIMLQPEDQKEWAALVSSAVNDGKIKDEHRQKFANFYAFLNYQITDENQSAEKVRTLSHEEWASARDTYLLRD